MTKSIKIANTEIVIADGPIGISLSGGADSSLLLYILMSNHTGPIHAFTCASEKKLKASARVSQQVVQRAIELTGNDKVVHHTWYVKEQTNEDLKSTVNSYMTLGLFNSRYVAVTANPPADIADGFTAINTQQQVRDPLVRRLTKSGNVYKPFTNTNKKRIGEMYTELEITDSLFPVTRSCESLDRDQGHCGRCWWCQERMWGFGRLD